MTKSTLAGLPGIGGGRTYTAPMPQVPYRPDEQSRRYRASEEELLAAGGKRVNVRLQPKAKKAMDRIMRKRKCDQTEAINWALENAA